MSYFRAPGDSNEIAEVIRDHLLTTAESLQGLGQQDLAEQSRYLAGLALSVGWAARPGAAHPAAEVSAVDALREAGVGLRVQELVLRTGLPRDLVLAELQDSCHVAERGGVWSILDGRNR